MNWLDILTATGAVLGTIAFFQNAFSGIAATNKTKWMALDTKVFSEGMLEVAIVDASRGQMNERTKQALLEMNNKLREKGDGLKFKSLWGDPYKPHLRELFEVTETMRSRISSPIWMKHKYEDSIGGLFALEEKYFLQKYGTQGADGEMDRVRDGLVNDLKRAQLALTAVRVLANREDIEYLLPWKWRVG
jgi:hypothetical protein